MGRKPPVSADRVGAADQPESRLLVRLIVDAGGWRQPEPLQPFDQSQDFTPAPLVRVGVIRQPYAHLPGQLLALLPDGFLEQAVDYVPREALEVACAPARSYKS